MLTNSDKCAQNSLQNIHTVLTVNIVSRFDEIQIFRYVNRRQFVSDLT
jgi:hypothetical protein